MKNNVRTLVLLLVAAVLGGILSIAIYSSFTRNSDASTAQKIPAKVSDYKVENITIPTFDFAEISERVTPTVVHIKTKVTQTNTDAYHSNPFFKYFDPRMFEMPVQGSGSGVIISDDGYIVTNNHVIEGATDIEVVSFDKHVYKATIIGRDENTDLAVIKINASDLAYLKYGNSDDLQVGEWVLAVGNPFNLTSTVTAGIVSAKARSIGILGRGSAVESFIQTDAAVNPGNSGGALVNVKGELVGINAAIASNTGAYQGYSFAIPSNLVVKIVEDIMEYGRVQRGYLGVNIQEVTQDIAREHNMKEIKGVLIADVMDNSAAKKAGIRKGDIILEIGDKEVNSVPELQEYVSMNRPGDKIKVTYSREGHLKEVSVVLKDLEGNTEIVVSETDKIEEILGAKLNKAAKDQLKEYGLENGVAVEFVGPGKFRNAGIKKGFIITRIDKKTVETPEDVLELISRSESGVLIEGYETDGSKSYYGFGLE